MVASAVRLEFQTGEQLVTLFVVAQTGSSPKYVWMSSAAIANWSSKTASS